MLLLRPVVVRVNVLLSTLGSLSKAMRPLFTTKFAVVMELAELTGGATSNSPGLNSVMRVVDAISAESSVNVPPTLIF